MTFCLEMTRLVDNPYANFEHSTTFRIDLQAVTEQEGRSSCAHVPWILIFKFSVCKFHAVNICLSLNIIQLVSPVRQLCAGVLWSLITLTYDLLTSKHQNRLY